MSTPSADVRLTASYTAGSTSAPMKDVARWGSRVDDEHPGCHKNRLSRSSEGSHM